MAILRLRLAISFRQCVVVTAIGCLSVWTMGCSGKPTNNSGHTDVVKVESPDAPSTNKPSSSESSVASATNSDPDDETHSQPDRQPVSEPDDATKAAFVEKLRPQVEKFCGDCHKTPHPESITKQRWPREVDQGFEFHRVSGVQRMDIPSVEDTINYFVYQAPVALSMPQSIVGNPPSRVKFQSTSIVKPASKSALEQPPCVSQLKWIDLEGDGQKSLVYCDLGTGSVFHFRPGVDESPQLIAVLFQPTSLDQVDLDKDGKLDLVVADLGEFLAADSDLGRVVWLRKKADGDGYDEVILQEGLGRVADVKTTDFDGDGDIDVLVAEFGWRTTGRILLLEQTASDDQGLPKFKMREIDPRHGTIEVPVADLNGDGSPDFVALISQEHEVVEAFINNGQGQFTVQTIFRADDPIYGSSRIELADVDGDGDVDVIYANGDSFDSGSKPFHSVQWLENEGAFPFKHHHITYMPGVLAIKAADFDGDGDLDIVAGSLMPKSLDEKLEAAGVESLILLEQTSVGEFERTQIQTSAYQNASIEVGDFDQDGHTDIAVGNFLHFQPQLPTRQDFMIWRNLGQTSRND